MSSPVLSVSISRTLLGLSTLVLPSSDYGFGHVASTGSGGTGRSRSPRGWTAGS
jgi:hypothetical protein